MIQISMEPTPRRAALAAPCSTARRASQTLFTSLAFLKRQFALSAAVAKSSKTQLRPPESPYDLGSVHPSPRHRSCPQPHLPIYKACYPVSIHQIYSPTSLLVSHQIQLTTRATCPTP